MYSFEDLHAIRGGAIKSNQGIEAKMEEKVMRQLDIFMEKSRI